MFDFGSDLVKAAVIISISLAVVISVCVVAYCIFKYALKQDNKDFYINKNGLVVKSKIAKKDLTPKKFMECMTEVIVYLEEAKEKYMDNIVGIKRRIFKQSKDYAIASISAVENEIIEEYKTRYMKFYTGNNHGQHGDWVVARNPTKAQLKESNIDDSLSVKSSNPCDPLCKGYCNSGLYYFDSKIEKDFRPILDRVATIIEENHLINRNDREFEEEIFAVASSLSSELKNKVLSYPIPIDNVIAGDVLDKLTPKLRDAIADALRRSRTLSGAKREWIKEEQLKYVTNRNSQLSRIITILGEEELNLILNSTVQMSLIDKDDLNSNFKTAENNG